MDYLVQYGDWLFVAGGLFGLFIGGEALVRGAVSVAGLLKLPKLLVGLTIVGFGTSMPELLVCLKAAQGGAPDVAIGNVVGSNIANILLIAAAGALIRPISTRINGMRRDAMVMMAATLAFAWLAFQGGITPKQGLIMAGGLVGYVLLVFVLDRKVAAGDGMAPEVKPLSAPAALGLIAVGLAALIFGADALVHGATHIATAAGVSQAVIGLTLVAVGTSLPELTVSLVSAVRGQNELALGNIVGSNIFNILAVLGLTAWLAPVTIEPKFLSVDIPVMIAAAAALCLIVLFAPRLGRLSAVAGLLAYAGYGCWLALGH